MSKLKELTRTLNGRYLLTIEMDGDPRSMFDELKDSDVDVTVKKHFGKRSNRANAYAWALIDKIAEVMRIGKSEVYRQTIKDIGGVSTTVCVPDKALDALQQGWKDKGLGWQTETFPSKLKGCTNVILYYGSSSYNSHQMGLLIEHLVQDAKALGIETLPPAELERMIEQHHAT